MVHQGVKVPHHAQDACSVGGTGTFEAGLELIHCQPNPHSCHAKSRIVAQPHSLWWSDALTLSPTDRSQHTPTHPPAHNQPLLGGYASLPAASFPTNQDTSWRRKTGLATLRRHREGRVAGRQLGRQAGGGQLSDEAHCTQLLVRAPWLDDKDLPTPSLTALPPPPGSRGCAAPCATCKAASRCATSAPRRWTPGGLPASPQSSKRAATGLREGSGLNSPLTRAQGLASHPAKPTLVL